MMSWALLGFLAGLACGVVAIEYARAQRRSVTQEKTGIRSAAPSREVSRYERPRVDRIQWRDLRPDARVALSGIVAELKMNPGTEDQHFGPFHLLLSLQGTISEVDEKFSALIGYTSQELHGRPIEWITVSDTMDIPKHLGAVVQFGAFKGLWLFKHCGGRAVVARYEWQLRPDPFIEMWVEPLTFASAA